MQLKRSLLVFAVACAVMVFGQVANVFAAAGDDSVYEWGPWGRQVVPAAGPQVVAPAPQPTTLGFRPGDNGNVTPTLVPLPPTPTPEPPPTQQIPPPLGPGVAPPTIPPAPITTSVQAGSIASPLF